MAVKVYKPEYPGLYYFDTFTFTTLGTSGNRGPDPTKGYANAPWNPDQFSIVDGQQQWTVPATGTYNIVAAGAYGATPGRVVSGDVDLYEGQVLSLLVGQQPTPLVANVADNVTVGGGGGTFVVSGGVPLIVASGGDGGAYIDNPWSQPVIVPTQTLYSGYINTLNDTGNVLATIDASNVISVFTYDGFIWSFQTSFPGILLNYSIVGIYGIKLNDTGDKFVHYSPSEIRVYSFNSFWDYELIPDSDLDIPGVYVYNCAFSGDGKTVVVGTNNTKLKVFKYTTSWTLDTTIIPPYDLTFVTNVVTSGVGILCDINYNGDRFATTVNYNKILVYDYPWTDPPFVIEQEDRLFGMSNDGNRIISINFNPTSLSNVYTYPWTNPPVSIDGSGLMSKDGQTILVPYLSPSSLRVYDTYPWNDYKLINPEPDSSPYWGLSIVPNYDGSVILISDPLNSWIGIYYKAFFSRSGGFSPFGNGLGDSGAGYLGDGSVSDPYFGFFKPKAYVNGGFGNSYEYGQPGVPKEGGFGGGQSPLGKNTGITIISSSVPPLTIASLYSYGHCLNRYATWCFLFTSSDICIYNFNGTTWDLIASLSEEVNGLYIYPSMSDDGSKVVYLNQTSGFGNRPELYDVKLFQDPWSTPQIIQTEQHGAKISGDGQWVVYSGPSGTYKYNISSDTHTKISDIVGIVVDTSNDGSMIALGSYNYVLLYPSLKEISYEGTPTIVTVSLSGDGTTLFVGKPETTAGNGPLYIYKDEVLQQTINQVADDFYRYTDYTGTKTCGVASGEVYVLLSGTYVKQQTVLNDLANHPFRQTHSMASNGLSISCSPGTNFLNVYTVSNVTVTTTTDHGYPYDYRVIISSTDFYNATWDIVTTSSNTFTFQAFGGPTETTGYVSGTTTGVSGGGGYTGSAGDGVSGATCYADPAVANFTDLGATGNTAGTVTISLIDPTPLKQKWMWDQTITTTAPKTAYQVVSWSDKLGKFQSLTGSSTDGIHWDGFTFFEVVANGGNSEFPFYTAYSDTLNLYIGLRTGLGFNFIYIISNDGIVWTEPVTEGLNVEGTEVMNNSSPFVWAPELGLFVYVTRTQILTSYDGIIWTERYYDPAFRRTRSIAYSPSIHTFVCTASWSSGYLEGLTSNTGVYSTDGLTWNTWTAVTYPVIEEQIITGTGYSVTWSPKLNIFVASVSYGFINESYSNLYIARSTDGQTWTTDGYNIPNDPGIYGWKILWSEELSIFTATPESRYQNTTIHSYDGINWSSITTSVSGSLAYSPSLQLFVVSDDSGLRQFISIDGIYYVDIAGYYPPPSSPSYTWGSQIGKFINADSVSGSVSSDGIHWEKTTATGKVLAWSPELGLFVGLTFDSQAEEESCRSYYSYDGKTWIDTIFTIPPFPPTPNPEDPENPELGDDLRFRLPYVAWSSTLGAFSGAFYSKDGISWSPSLIGCTAVGWSSFHGMFVAFYYTYVYYSYDGITWSTGNNTTEFNGIGTIACSSSGRFVCEAMTITQGIPFETPDVFVPQGVLYSDDGINWISPGVAFPFSGPIWAEELSIFVGGSWNSYQGSDANTGWVSSDGITWSQLDFQLGSWSPELGLFLSPGGYSPVTKTF